MDNELKWHTETRKVSELKAHPKNPRKISKEQMEQIKKSIQNFDYVELVAINQDGTILAGHMRTKALKELGRGKEEIEVRVPNRLLSDSEAEEYLIRSNKSTGEWDFEILGSHWNSEELLSLGFLDKELEFDSPISLDEIEDSEISLPDGERGMQQMTFTLSKDQVNSVETALSISKKMGSFIETGNENSNGNALARIIELWMGHYGKG